MVKKNGKAQGHGHNKTPRHSIHTIPQIQVSPPTVTLLPLPPDTPRSKSVDFTGQDLSDFTLPELVEEEVDGKDFRSRSGSTGLRSFLKFRGRNKSGDSSSSKNNTPKGSPPDEKGKGFKGFLDNLPFRQRSKSDAAASKAMIRRRHISGGTVQPPSVVENDNTNIGSGAGDMEQYGMRNRSTSWGARDRLRAQKEKELKISGAVLGGVHGVHGDTPMSQLLGNNSAVAGNRKLTAVEKNGDNEHKFTGKALIWQKSLDDASKRRPSGSGSKSSPSTPVGGYMGNMASGNAKSRRDTFSKRKWNTADVTELDQMEIEDLEVDDPMIFNKFMRAHKCYDLIPTSAKLVVFDTQLTVKKAFYALVYNCVRAAPLWDHAQQRFIGMLTISDFIQILIKHYKPSMEIVDQLEEHKIQSWREGLSHYYKDFVCISPDASVHTAVRLLISSKVHRLPVVDKETGNALYILTHKRILKFLHIFMKSLPKPSYMHQTIAELNIGTYDNVATVYLESKLIDTLRIFVQKRISALPVIDKDGKVINIYAKFDVLNLAAEKTYTNLDIPVSLALNQRKPGMENVLVCKRTDTLDFVIDKIAKAEIHRLVVVRDNGTLDGIISLSDILTYLLNEDVNELGKTLVATTCSASTLVDDDKMDMFPEPLETI